MYFVIFHQKQVCVNVFDIENPYLCNVKKLFQISLERIEDLSRKSVISLESRLDRVTVEMQERLNDLQSNLSEEKHQKTILEQKISDIMNANNILTKDLHEERNKIKDLMKKNEAAQLLIIEKENIIEHLNKDREIFKKCDAEGRELQIKLESSQKNVKKIEAMESKLRKDNNKLEKELEVHVVVILNLS